MKILICSFLLSMNIFSINSDDAFSIVTDKTNGKYIQSVWSGMHGYQVLDINQDGFLDYVALIKDAKNKKASNPPTHILIVEGNEKNEKFKSHKNIIIKELDNGVPMDDAETFVIENNIKQLKKAKCNSKIAIKMIEEASTAFFLCYMNGKYSYTRDPEDTP